MGRLKEEHLALLDQLQQAGPGEWVTEAGVGGFGREALRHVRGLGLCELGGDVPRAATSASAAPPGGVRLTPDGRDVLLFAHHRGAQVPVAVKESPADHREVSLLPSEMETLRAYLAVGERLSRPPAAGLAAAVDDARLRGGPKRWLLRVNTEQQRSIAHAFHLEGIVDQVRAANRFAREYGIQHDGTSA